jgi:trk system potassium uptake protein TrkH
MLYREIFKILGIYWMAFSGIMIIPLLLAGYYEFYLPPTEHPQPHSSGAFLSSIIICFCAGLASYLVGRRASGQLFKREGIAAIVLIWVLTPLFASLPYLFSNTLDNPFQAYFEATSGLSTTGASTMHSKHYDPVTNEEVPITQTFGDVNPITYSFYGTIPPIRDPVTHAILYKGTEAVSKAILFWRCLMEWLGGVGIVVLFVAIFPSLGISGKLLSQSDMIGPIKDAIAPRITQAAFQLWAIYSALTALLMILLHLTNSSMSWFDAVTIAFATLSGGGSSNYEFSISHFQSATTEWILILFMVLASTNFTVYYFAVRGKFYRIYQPELWVYLIILLTSCSVASWYLIGTEKILLSGESMGFYSTGEAIRDGFFQIVSFQTSTGFVTADYDRWPNVVQMLMLVLTFVGGMSGSTASGIKIVRFLIYFRIAKYRVESLFRPQAVRQFKVGGQVIGGETVALAFVFFYIMIAVTVIGTLLYIINGVDILTAVSLTASMVNNLGVGFRMAGPMESYAFLSDFGLGLSCLLMILGRLEYLIVLTVLVPAFWKRTV